MRKAITISVLFHVALLTWALGYFSTGDNSKPVKKTTLPVDIMTPSQFTKIKAGKKTAPKKKTVVPLKKKKNAKKKPAKKPVKIAKAKPKLKQKRRPKRKKVVKAKPKPKPKPKKVVKARPKPKPKKIVKAKSRPKPKPVKRKVVRAHTKPKPKRVAKAKPVRKKVSRPKSDFDPENIAALLNKLPDKKVAPRRQPLAPVPQRQAPIEPPSYGRSYGTDVTMSANEIDAFKAQISQCWSPPTRGLGSRDLNVKLRIRFKRDGTLEKPPELANYSGSPFFRPAAEAAKRAVWQCQPYRMPKDKFATWQDMILNFDPREMLGG